MPKEAQEYLVHLRISEHDIQLIVVVELAFLDVMIAFSLTSDHTPLCFRMDLDPLPILPTQALSSFLIAGFIDPLL